MLYVPRLGKDVEHCIARGSRGTTFIRWCLTTSTLWSKGSFYTLYSVPVNGGIRQGLLSHGAISSCAPGFIRGWLAYGLSSTRPLSGCNRGPLLVPSKLCRFGFWFLLLRPG